MTDSSSLSIGPGAKGNIGHTVKDSTYIEHQTVITPEAIELRPFQARSPYKALKRFDVDDSEYFFGRYQLTRELQATLETSNLILVLGASGSGKSSVVRAKLIPEFLAASSKCHNFVLTPKDDPFQSLYESLIGRDKVGPDKNYCFSESKAQFVLEGKPKGKPDVLAQVVRQLKDKDSGWLIFIDQFEELFTRCTNLEQRENFIQSIAQIAESHDCSVKIVLAMRADFLGEFNPYPQFGRIVQRQIHLVNQMPEDELELAIKGPAAKHGVRFEPGLAKEIISDVQGQAASLPLMQYTLGRLWEYEVNLDKLANRTLNTQNYQALGKVRGALEQHVNEIYGAFGAVAQQATKRIFLSLVKVFTTEGVDKRVSQSVARSALQGEAVSETIDRLINENLLVSSSKNLSQAALLTQNGNAFEQQATIEIAHEILLTSWTKLQDWIQEGQATLLIKSRLVEDMGRWHEQKQANQELLKSSVLTKILELKEKHLFELQSVPLLREEEAYIAASQRFQKRELNRAKRVAVGASIGLVFMAGAALFALSQVRQAQRQRVEQLAANAEFLLADNQPVNAVIHAIAATGLSHSALVQFPPHPQVTSADGSLLNVTPFNGEQNQLFHAGKVTAVAFSPDGQRIVSGSSDSTVRIWDAKTGMPIGQPLIGHTDQVNAVAFSSDGQRIVSSSSGNTMRIWDAKTGAPIGKPLQLYGKGGVAFSPDGQRVVIGSWDNTVRIWDAETAAPISEPLIGHTNAVYLVAFSLDGQRLVSSSLDKTMRIWDAKTGAPIGKPLVGHTEAVFSVAFSPDGQRIVSSSLDGVRIWDAKTGAPVGKPFQLYEGLVISVKFSLDGQRIISNGLDNTVQIWDAETGAPIGTPLMGHTDQVSAVAFSPDGQRIASSSWDNTVRIWDAKTGAPIGKPFQSYTTTLTVKNTSFTFSRVVNSPDGQRILIIGSNTVQIRDAKTDASIGKPLIGHTGMVYSAAFSPDGQHIVSGSLDKTVQIWDAETGAPIGKPLMGHTDEVYSVAFSPDGQRIVSGSFDKTVRIWDAETGAPIGKLLQSYTDKVDTVAFSLDSQRIVSSNGDNTVRIWDISWESLLERACNQLRHHPSLNQPTTEVAREAKQTCERYVWKR